MIKKLLKTLICLLIAKAFCSSVFLLSCLLIGKENLKIWKCLSDWLKRTAMFCLERKKGKFDQSENRTVFKAPMTKQKEMREQHYKIDSLTFTYYYSYAETRFKKIYLQVIGIHQVSQNTSEPLPALGTQNCLCLCIVTLWIKND